MGKGEEEREGNCNLNLGQDLPGLSKKTTPPQPFGHRVGKKSINHRKVCAGSRGQEEEEEEVPVLQ